MITKERVLQCLTYDRTTGSFFWKETRRGVRIGEKAGYTSKNGYIFIRIDGNLYRSHRLVWLVENGKFPDLEIDHIDGNRSNNYIYNLREVSKIENQKNQGIRIDNISGHSGIMWYKKGQKWHVQITHDGVKYHIGYFDKIEDAIKARMEADIKFNFHKNHGKRKSYRES